MLHVSMVTHLLLPLAIDLTNSCILGGWGRGGRGGVLTRKPVGAPSRAICRVFMTLKGKRTVVKPCMTARSAQVHCICDGEPGDVPDHARNDVPHMELLDSELPFKRFIDVVIYNLLVQGVSATEFTCWLW
jgi:hypothetical protein